MPAIESNQVGEMIAQNVEDAALKRTLLEKLNALVQLNEAEDAEDEGEKAPPVKKQFSIVLSDPTGRLTPEFFKASGFDGFTGWVVQIPEDASVMSATERIHKAAYEFNTTKKGRMIPAKTVADAIENVPAKHFKEQQVWVKTKVPVFIVITDNEIPTEASDKMEGDDVTMTLMTGGKTVTLTSGQMRRAADRLKRVVETADGRRITPDEMLGEIKAKFEGGAK